ncbi:MAG: alpha-L-rhamnosidase [Ignavibacteriaceae bacterium]
MMRLKLLGIAFFLLMSGLDCFAQQKFSISVANLECEHLPNPIGIDDASPRISWQLIDPRFGARQTAFQILVGTDSLELLQGHGFYWNSGKIQSDNMLITYSGKALHPFTRYYWNVEVWDKDGKPIMSKVAFFETGYLTSGDWKGEWISDSYNKNYKPAPYFRKVFEVDKRIKSARVYIAVAGLYELYINGKKIGHHYLDPMFTRFDRRTLYVTYDVTTKLRKGKNAIGVILGNGWYNMQSKAVWNFDTALWRQRPAFCLDLRITYEDGAIETVSSGGDWKTSPGPIVSNSIYTGEIYDDRLLMQGWDMPDFYDSTWNWATFHTAPSNHIVAQVLYPIRIVKAIPPKDVVKINDSTYVFNLGRNISGVCKFTAQGSSGTVFRLKYGEKLNSDGTVNQSNINEYCRSKDFQTDVFTLNGKGKETFLPRFTYHGFQYVEVSCNKPILLTRHNLLGYFMHSDVPTAGYVHTSNRILNKIWWATNNSYLSNLFGYPTDCPTREKNGWTGDAQFAIETGLFNFDGITIYEKWMADHRDEQQPNGVLPAIIPTSGWGYRWANGPDWTSSIAIIPWELYQFYGDSKCLSECYENIKRYVDHISSIYHSGLTTWGLGDWVPVKSKSPIELTSSVYYFIDASILSRVAKLFGNWEDYKKYSALVLKIKRAINEKYLNRETGLYGEGTQTDLSVPLYWGIVPKELRRKVAYNLANKVESDSFHVDVGVLGERALLNALSNNGYANIAYKVASQKTFPSWGWWIAKGATTLYEDWAIDNNSLNHIMFGEISAWMYEALGGINPDSDYPGFKRVILKPHFPESLDSFECWHISPFGKIISKWRKQNGIIYYTVTIPANSSAKLFIDKAFSVKLSTNENSKYYVSQRDGYILLKAGTYEFKINRTAKNR